MLTAQPERTSTVLLRTRAFGLEIESSFEAPGLPPATGPAQGPHVRMDLVSAEAIDADWPATDATRVLEEHFGEGPPARTIDSHPEAGYRLYARHFGLARISPSGDRVTCAPPNDEPWSWQRFLVGRILPWAAVLRGHEAFHASAVAVRGRAVAFVGETGAGKTSLAVQLVARGADFLTDDVLALSRGGDHEVLAHAGAAIASVRPAERDAMPRDRWAALGHVLGESGKTYVALPRADGRLPLGALYFLTRGATSEPETVPVLHPRLLLASTFVLGVQTRERLHTQLDVCAAIAHGVPAFRLPVAPGVSADELAQIVQSHLSELNAW
jgi:hypothetical protein